MAGSKGSSPKKKFTIDDAFEEDHDDAIRVYGSTTERSPLRPKTRGNGTVDTNVAVWIEDPHNKLRDIVASNHNHNHHSVSGKFKLNDDVSIATSKDSDSLIQESASSGIFDPSQSWWHHPKIKENWKMVLAAFVLLIIGIGLVATGIVVVSLPIHGVQAFVFFIAGAICFIPGAYHVIYIYLAVKGKRGYDFYHLPLFN